jgi:acetolactate synthase-1/2/3 large subunit
MAEMTGAECLAEMFEGYGVTHVFFVPTILSQTLVEMEKRTGIARIVTHGEKAAAYMADGYARATGRPGICMAQGVGAANLAVGLRDAALAASPVIAITGGPTAATRGRRTYQQSDDLSLFAPLTKESVQVSSVERLPDVFRQAFRSATTGRPGPVHVELDGHFGQLDEEVGSLDVVVEERFAQVPAFRPEPEPGAVVAALELLARAERPVIVAGGGVRSSRATAELVALAEALAIPVVTSMNAKDTMPGSHPLNGGVVGLYSRNSANRIVVEADLVFFVGSAAGSQVTLNWQLPGIGIPVIQLDVEPAELGRHYPNAVSILGDARVTLQHLVDAAPTVSTRHRHNWIDRVTALGDEWIAEWRPFAESDAVPVRPERLCRELTNILPDDAVVVVDTGHAGMWTAGMVDLNGSNQSYLRAAGSLGWGLPASIGAKLAVPDRPVVLFTGDGGLWYHIAELESAVRWGVGVVAVVNDNHSLSQEISVYEKAYGGDLHGRHSELWQFEDVDLAAVAESIGAIGLRVTKPDEISGTLMRAITQANTLRRPVVVDVVTEMSALAPLPDIVERATA